MGVKTQLVRWCVAVAVSVSLGFAQVDLKSDAVVYFGSCSNTSAPAVLDEQKVREATPEWQTIQAEGVRRGSARYMLLVGDMDRRVRAAARTAASNASKDLVVRSGDIQNDNGKTVVDITSDVIANL